MVVLTRFLDRVWVNAVVMLRTTYGELVRHKIW